MGTNLLAVSAVLLVARAVCLSVSISASLPHGVESCGLRSDRKVGSRSETIDGWLKEREGAG